MKKICGIIILTLILGCINTSLGQDLQQQFEEMKQSNYLNQIGVYFVNEITKATPKYLNIDINKNEEKEITLLFKNESKDEVRIRIGFTDAVMENGEIKGCSANYAQGLEKFIIDTGEREITVDAESQIEKKFKLKFPAGMNGIYNGCIAYGAKEDEDTEERMVAIITRKVLYIDFFIRGDEGIKYQISTKNIVKTKNTEGELEIGIQIKNEGNITSSIQIDGKISNILGFERTFSLSGNLLAENTQIYTVNIGNLPNYGGIFTISTTITDTPIFHFDPTEFGIDKASIVGGEQEIKSHYFQFHRWMLIALAILIIIIFKKIYRYPNKEATEI